MIYLFILGKNPTLSIAELANRFASLGWDYSFLILTEEIAIIKLDRTLPEPEHFLDELGGIQKISQLLGDFSEFDRNILIASLAQWLRDNNINTIGLSCYNLPPHLASQILSFGLDLKKLFKHERKLRYLTRPPKALSTAQIIANKLLTGGRRDLTIAGAPPLIGVFFTVAVQNINAYTLRDIGKPYRSQSLGMLPPKIAQIMLNLSQKNPPAKIYDPFCGSGTILIEASLRGFQVMGSDLDKAQITGCEKNLLWLKDHFRLSQTNPAIFQADATKIGAQDLPGIPDFIVSELYLGPRFIPKDPRSRKEMITRLLLLYEDFLANLKHLGIRNAVLAFPFYLDGSIPEKLPLLDLFRKLNYDIKSPLPSDLTEGNQNFMKYFDRERKSLNYNLQDQKVGREIFILENKK